METATIIVNGRPHVAEVNNVSGGGAMVRSPIRASLWDRIDLILDEGGPIRCAVRWLRGDRIGLEFEGENAAGPANRASGSPWASQAAHAIS
ncbi:MAG TPA: PilZ domain-containing protein [Sphingomicrobium sp.]|nr:PilZ domain-containing protein [Sphingomicrobium sp.]